MDPWVQVLRKWHLVATKQGHHRAILDKCVRQMQHGYQAKAFHTWSAAAHRTAEAQATAEECRARLAIHHIKQVLNTWRVEAMYKGETKSKLKARNTGS